MLLGRPVFGLASANTETSGKEFLDGEEEDWDSLRSMFVWVEEWGDRGFVCLDPISLFILYHFVPMDFGLPGYALWKFWNASSAVFFRRV